MKTEIRLAEEKDVPQFLEWSANTPNNLFDPGIANYPNLRVFAADQNDKPVLYVPFHPVMVVESLAHKPDITTKENARALRKVQDELEALAKVYGIAEVWWQCSDQSLVAFAERHGYEVLKNAVTLRKKVQ